MAATAAQEGAEMDFNKPWKGMAPWRERLNAALAKAGLNFMIQRIVVIYQGHDLPKIRLEIVDVEGNLSASLVEAALQAKGAELSVKLVAPNSESNK
jgi:hypothetical protein